MQLFFRWVYEWIYIEREYVQASILRIYITYAHSYRPIPAIREISFFFSFFFFWLLFLSFFLLVLVTPSNPPTSEDNPFSIPVTHTVSSTPFAARTAQSLIGLYCHIPIIFRSLSYSIVDILGLNTVYPTSTQVNQIPRTLIGWLRGTTLNTISTSSFHFRDN